MNKQEYISRLNELLACLPADHRLESISFYEEMIDDRMEDGMTEEQAVAALDAPGIAAEKILDDLPAVPRVVVKTRRKSRALLWGAAIIGSPLWVALTLAFAAAVLGIYFLHLAARGLYLGDCHRRDPLLAVGNSACVLGY